MSVNPDVEIEATASLEWLASSRKGRDVRGVVAAALEATQEQMDGFLSQLPYKCYEEVASVGDGLKICPQLDSRVVVCFLRVYKPT